HFVEEVLLAAEVVIGERQIDAGALGNGAQRDAVKSAVGETLFCSVKDREPGAIATARARAFAGRFTLALLAIAPRFRRGRDLALHSSSLRSETLRHACRPEAGSLTLA